MKLTDNALDIRPEQQLDDVKDINELCPASGQNFESWWNENKDELAQAQAFSVASMSDEPAVMGQELSRANSEQARMGFLLVDANSFVNKAEATAMMRVRQEYADLSAAERKVLSRADDQYLQAVRLRDTLEIIVNALKSKSMAYMNLRRTTFTPHQSHE